MSVWGREGAAPDVKDHLKAQCKCLGETPVPWAKTTVTTKHLNISNHTKTNTINHDFSLITDPDVQYFLFFLQYPSNGP